MKRTVIITLLLALGVILQAQNPVSIAQVGTTAVTTTVPVSGTVIANAGSGTLNVACTSGCSGGTTDTDDGTIASGQSTGLMIGISQVFDGTNWKRFTIGTAGTASAQVVTIQGIAAMTKLLVTPDSVALPANQSTNVAQLAGTTTDTNSGVKSAGTLRVVLATDQPALTNKLLVTPDSVALPANQSVNINQINSVTPLMGNGATGTGALRVSIANDSTGIVALTTSTAQIGHLEANQSSNVAQINGVTPLMGNGASGTGAQRVTLANDSTGIVALTTGSAQIGHLEANQSTNVAQMNGVTVLMGAGNTGTGSQRVTLATDQVITPSSVGTTATTTDSSLGCYILSTASTNSNNCKGSAGNFYGVRVVNTTATLYYLRLYNASGAPTCSSATGFIETIPVPASATGAGIMAVVTIPIGYTTGIGYCLTGGSSSTDNTNAAAGIFGAIYYK